jgi:hypothetical protein
MARCSARFSRHAPLKSTTRNPRVRASGTSSRETPCGVARNNNSTPCCCNADHENGATATLPSPFTATEPPREPLSSSLSLPRRNKRGSSVRGCRPSSRASSRPEYPVAPRIAVLSFATITQLFFPTYATLNFTSKAYLSIILNNYASPPPPSVKAKRVNFKPTG